MNKIFITLLIIINVTFIFYFNYKDFTDYKGGIEPEISNVKEIVKYYPHINKVGLYTNLPDKSKLLYQLQNTLMPVFVEDNVNNKYLFCYSENDFCKKIIEERPQDLLKQYSDNLLLLERKDI